MRSTTWWRTAMRPQRMRRTPIGRCRPVGIAQRVVVRLPSRRGAALARDLSYPSYEPNGELTSMTTPLGYTRTFSYAPSQQAGLDYGLPTAVTGDSYPQLDGPSITPTQSFWYDANGKLRCYSKGAGTYGAVVRRAGPYDERCRPGRFVGQRGFVLRQEHRAQPAGTRRRRRRISPTARCSRTQTPAATSESGGFHGVHVRSDGDVKTETHHYGCIAPQPCAGGVTTKWYDGADRLVETMLPTDPTDYDGPLYSHSNWITRYLYDLSAGGLVSYLGTSFAAHGNLYKTQEVFNGQNPSIIDIKGQAFDSLDRLVTTYTVEPGGQAVRTTMKSYDGAPASLGLLTSNTVPAG